MSLRRKTFRGSLILTVGEAVSYGASFIRNMILARILTKADFGIAAAFAMVITLLEFSARLGIGRFVVRDRQGDQPEFIATAQLVQFVAALGSSLLIAGAAGPLGLLFGLGDQGEALLILALVPAIRGLENLDLRRMERELRFGPTITVETVPQVIITIAAWPLAVWLQDYRVVLVLLIAKAVFTVLGTHVLAERPYAWKVRGDHVRSMLRFGWPLLINGFLMFGVFHGDQFLIASFYTMADLAPYAAAATLTFAPSFVFARILSSVMLPVMAKVQDDAPAFRRRYQWVISVVGAFTVVYGVAVIIGAEALMRLVFGSKYAGAGVLLGWLAAANVFRIIRIAPGIAALAKGDSKNQMISNMWRVVALVPALILAMTHQEIWWIASVGLLGEALACTVSFLRLTRRDGIPFARSAGPTGLAVVGVIMAGAIVQLGVYEADPILALGVAVVAAGFSGGLMILILGDLRTEVVKGWNEVWSTMRSGRMATDRRVVRESRSAES